MECITIVNNPTRNFLDQGLGRGYMLDGRYISGDMEREASLELLG